MIQMIHVDQYFQVVNVSETGLLILFKLYLRPVGQFFKIVPEGSWPISTKFYLRPVGQSFENCICRH